ncbi:MAG: alkene reductase [Burkholderiaceae bacterium]|jgi:N-ethylmaleimide reductase|nr:alkene reductase [Burkholderiaceae bacterium]
MATLYESFQIGDLVVPNRIVMAPLTRSRANEQCEPTDLAVTYYTQRATAGLIISEASQISQQGQGYICTPGIYTEGQVKGWRRVTDAVHAAGGRMCLQLWHVGRISHTHFQPHQAPPVAPSAIRAQAKVFIPSGFEDCSMPRALETAEIAELVKSYAQAAQNAKQAGFDMIELHGANGYLIDQFLRDQSNQRTDAFGGSIENRMRFPLQVVDALCQVYPSHRVGIRLSPAATVHDADDSDPLTLFSELVRQLGQRRLGYLHLVEGQTLGPRDWRPAVDLGRLKKIFRASGGLSVIANNGYDRQMAERAVEDGSADMIAFGVPFIANPDLVARLQHGYPLNQADSSTFYKGGAKGYTDYPFYAA